MKTKLLLPILGLLLTLAWSNYAFSDNDEHQSDDNKHQSDDNKHQSDDDEHQKSKDGTKYCGSESRDTDGRDRDGRDKDGRDKDGRDKDGRDKDGRDKDGRDKDGRDKDGRDQNGRDKDGRDQNGRDKDGRDQNGRDRDGHTKDGTLDQNGRDKDGRDKDGRDKDGYDKNGRDKDGRDKDGRDKDGRDEDGLDKEGRDKDGRDSEGHDKDGRDKDGRDKDGRDKEGRSRDGHDKDCPSKPVVCQSPAVLNSVTKVCTLPAGGTACTAVTATPPAASDDDGKKVTICHFPPGNPNNVQIISISKNALSTHISHHGDSFWESGKSCPTDTHSCDTPCPTGQAYNANNVCEAKTCPTGQELVSGVCQTKSCPTGQQLVGDVCTTSCPAGQSPVNNVCTDIPAHTPTILTIDGQDYTSPTPIRTENTAPTITGTVDTGSNGALGNDSFTVSFVKSGGTTTNGTLTPALGSSSKTWAAIPATALTAGIYNIVATRAGTIDVTSDELIVGIAICDTKVDKYILRSEWETNGKKEGVNYYLGKCNASTTTPLTFSNLDSVKVNEPGNLTICSTQEGGGARSTGTISAATIKQASIMDATITNASGTIGDFSATKATYRYGQKRSTSGAMDISGAIIDSTNDNKATRVTLTGVILDNGFVDVGSFDTKSGFIVADTVDTLGSFIESINKSTGVFNPATAGISVTGTTIGTISSGMITLGTDANSNPVRGRIISGAYNGTQSIKARRVDGVLSGDITNATTTTIKGADGSIKTFVTASRDPLYPTTISNMSFQNATAFGVATHITITEATIQNANYCFSSGTVGSRGQLNWKEKVK